MTDEEYIAQHEELVRKALDALGEHFETVRLFVTFPNQNACDRHYNFSEGRGNYFAQLGQVKEWIIVDDERVRINERRVDEEEDD